MIDRHIAVGSVFMIQPRRVKKHNVFISVMGTMASGKTTAARLVAHGLGLQLVEENFGKNAFLSRFYADMKRWAFHSQTFFLMEKTQQLLQIAHRKHSGFVQDTPIQQDVFSYAKAQHVVGNMDDAEWKLYQKIYRSLEPKFPKPDLILFLDTSIPVIMDRLRARGRTFEKQISESYLELLDMLNRKLLIELENIKIVTIPTDDLNIVKSNSDKAKMVELVNRSLADIQ